MRSKAGKSLLKIYLDGRIDSSNASSVEKEIMYIIRSNEGSDVTFDAEKLKYISSAGLRVLLKVRKLKGKSIEINVPAGTQVGDTLRVAGQGVPELRHPERRGNLYVTIGISIPKKVSSFEKELLQKLDEGAGPKKSSKKGVFKK